tara:strand:- start:651 stop:983 length:333 start_codon:yes stop_codon:yes gene_type:complete
MSGLVDQSADARSKTIGGNFRVRAFADIALDGSYNRGQGFSATSKPGTGSYKLDFTVPASTTDYIVVGSANAAGGYNVSVHDKQSSYFKISVTYEHQGPYNSAFHVIVMY